MEKAIFKVGIDKFENLSLRKTYKEDNLYFLNKEGNLIESFCVYQNTKYSVHCQVQFHKSSETKGFLPRYTFFANDNKGDKIMRKVIAFSSSEEALNFALLMNFINHLRISEIN
jgi:hypothetical protein